MGADVNAHGGPGETNALHDAAAKGHKHVLEYLIAAGGSFDVDTPVRNPLFGAISGGHTDIARCLLDADINANVVYRGESGKLKNALSYALDRHRKEIADMLTAAGCRMPEEGVDVPVVDLTLDQQETVGQIPLRRQLDDYRQKIVAYVAKQVGPVDKIAIQETVPVYQSVRVAINIVRPSASYPFLTLFTTGMSAEPMTVPAGQESFERAELVMHLPHDWPIRPNMGAQSEHFWPIEWMCNAAYYPHLNGTWLGGRFAIIASDEPPKPLGPNTEQSRLFLIADFEDWSPVEFDDISIKFFTVIPIDAEERELEIHHGREALLQRFQVRGVSSVIDVNRANAAFE